MRYEDWQQRLADYIDECRSRVFAWGSFDCCLFAAGSCDAIAGTTYVADLSVQYTDEASAMTYLASFDTLEAAVSSWLGNSKAPNWAGTGDIVLSTFASQATIGVCLGNAIAFIGPSGLSFLRREVIDKCWTVE